MLGKHLFSEFPDDPFDPVRRVGFNREEIGIQRRQNRRLQLLQQETMGRGLGGEGGRERRIPRAGRRGQDAGTDRSPGTSRKVIQRRLPGSGGRNWLIVVASAEIWKSGEPEENSYIVYHKSQWFHFENLPQTQLFHQNVCYQPRSNDHCIPPGLYRVSQRTPR